MKNYIDFNDYSIPIGKRKVHYVKWLISKYGYSLDKARLYCARKFRDEESQIRRVRQYEEDRLGFNDSETPLLARMIETYIRAEDRGGEEAM